MAPYRRRPDPTRSGPLGIVQAKLNPPNKPSRHDKQELLNELARVRQHLELRAEANLIIADIRDRLRERIRTHEFWMPVDDLQEDVAHFTRLCRCFARRGRP